MMSRNRVRTLGIIFGLTVLLLAVAQCTQAPLTQAPAGTLKPSTPIPLSTPKVPLPTATVPSTPAREPTSSKTFLIGPTDQTTYGIPLTIRHRYGETAILQFSLDPAHEGFLLIKEEAYEPGGWEAIPFQASSDPVQVTLTGIDEHSSYLIQVGLGDGDSGLRYPLYQGTEWGPVRLQPYPIEEGTLRIGIVGDSGHGGQTTYHLVERLAEYPMDFVLHTGDLVYNAQEHPEPRLAYAEKLYLPFRPLLTSLPFYPVLGNHEYDFAARWQDAPFYDYAFPGFIDPRFERAEGEGRISWYAFAHQDIQFVMLDSQAFYGTGGLEEQTDWLVDRLADPRFSSNLLIMHIPPYSSGLHVSDGRPLQSRWVPLFEDSNVPLVLSGHDHTYERLVIEGITYLISGGGTSSLYARSVTHPGSRVFASVTHFVYLEITESDLRLEAIGIDGELIDQADLTLP